MNKKLLLYLLLALATTAIAQKEPRIALPLYINGNHQSPDTLPAIIIVNLNSPNPSGGSPKRRGLGGGATQHSVGTVWGLAYDRSRGLLYSSAFLKRHAGLGPLGAGGLYVSNLHTNQT